jgi:oligoendopeptidase F
MKFRPSLLTLAIPFALVAQAPVPDYSQTPRGQVPVADTWNVGDLFATEEAWRNELEAVEKLASGIGSLATDWTASPKAMADLLERLTEIEKRARLVAAFASFQGDGDMADSKFQKMKGEVQTFFVNFGSKIAFVESDLLRLGSEKVQAYLKSEVRLAPYRRNLEQILRKKDHVLPESEQRIASLTELFGSAASKASGMLNNVEMPRPEVTLKDGKKVVLSIANYQKYRGSKVVEDRRAVMEAYFSNLKRFENTFASLLDGNVKQDFFNAKIRKYPSCLEAALFENAIEPAVYRNLVSTVRANLEPLHRLLRLRQRMLGLPEFRYGDIYASSVASVERIYPYDEAKKLVLAATAPLGEDYRKALQRAFTERWVDVYPNQGKRSGAYSSGVYGLHPFVLMNYDGSYHEVSTLAHELGHAMHSFFSDQSQPHPTSDYPIFLAEIASTFNEGMLVNHLLKAEKDEKLKLYLLDSYLEGIRGTLYRQTLFADFELATHEAVEQGKTLTADWLNARYLELTRLYYGHDKGIVKVEDYIQSEWASVPHFYRDFYVFQYATGIVASMALNEAVLQGDAQARDRYLAFLKAGGSDFPLQTLKKAGVDMTSPKPIEAAIRTFERYVAEMEKLVERMERRKK